MIASRPELPLLAAGELAFFDTGIVLNAYDAEDASRRDRALLAMHAAMQSGRFVISTQVMHEFYNVALRRQLLAAADALAVLRHLAVHRVVPAYADGVLRAMELQRRHRLAVGDALLVQAALDARCSVLYSDELQAGLRFESPSWGPALTIVNLFSPPTGSDLAVHERSAAYVVTPEKVLRQPPKRKAKPAQ